VLPLYTTVQPDHLREDMANISATLDRLIDQGSAGPIAGDAVLIRYAGMRRMIARASHALRMVTIEFSGMSLATCRPEERDERFQRLRAGLSWHV
jgi:hypothetical protein